MNSVPGCVLGSIGGRRYLASVYWACLAAMAPAWAAPAVAGDLSGHWEGVVELPTVGEIQVMVDLSRVGDTWTGSIDLPMMGKTGVPLGNIVITTDRVRFSLEGVSGEPTFDGRIHESEIRGTYSQFGASAPFRLSREAVKRPARPQEPKPPFPYLTEEVTYYNGDIKLVGTLSLPPGDGAVPGVVMITGSGRQDRDETVLGHKPFLVIADHLTRSGIAVLRMDDRGAGESTGNIFDATSSDFAEDALIGVRWLKAHDRVAGDRIGLLGHSEGGTVAALAASRSSNVAFVIMLAGAAVPLSDVFPRQIELIGLLDGDSKDKVDAEVALWRELFDIHRTEPDESKLDAAVHDVVERLAELETSDEDPESRAASRKQTLKLVRSRWFRYIAVFDPFTAIREVKVPLLALNGGLDLQVDAAQNLPRIRQAVREGHNADATVLRLAGVNHAFQRAETGRISEYAAIEETISPEVLTILSDWISARFVQR